MFEEVNAILDTIIDEKNGLTLRQFYKTHLEYFIGYTLVQAKSVNDLTVEDLYRALLYFLANYEEELKRER